MKMVNDLLRGNPISRPGEIRGSREAARIISNDHLWRAWVLAETPQVRAVCGTRPRNRRQSVHSGILWCATQSGANQSHLFFPCYSQESAGIGAALRSGRSCWPQNSAKNRRCNVADASRAEQGKRITIAGNSFDFARVKVPGRSAVPQLPCRPPWRAFFRFRSEGIAKPCKRENSIRSAARQGR